jgi:hypothetical protein
MAINTIAISQRTLPWDPHITATGGYTLPKHVYIPHPSLQAISSGHIPQPSTGMQATVLVTPNLTAGRPMPGMRGNGVYGIRSVHFKATPG